jgi:hypothetical protein
MKKESFINIQCARLPWTEYPMLKFSTLDVMCDTTQGFNGRFSYCSKSMLFDIEKDYKQYHPICDEKLEHKYCSILKEEMRKADSPQEQFERLGI